MRLSLSYICKALAYELGIISMPGFQFFSNALEESLTAPALLDDMDSLFLLTSNNFQKKHLIQRTEIAVREAWNTNPARFTELIGIKAQECPTLPDVIKGCYRRLYQEKYRTCRPAGRLNDIMAASDYFTDQIGFTFNSYTVLRPAIRICLTDSICLTSLSRHVYSPIAEALHLAKSNVELKINSVLKASNTYVGKEFIGRILNMLPIWTFQDLCPLNFFRGLYSYAYKNGYITDFTRTKLCRWGIFPDKGFTFLSAAVDLKSGSSIISTQEIIHEIAIRYGMKESTVNNKMEQTLQQCWLRGIGEFTPFLLSKSEQADLSFELFFYLWTCLREESGNENTTAKER